MSNVPAVMDALKSKSDEGVRATYGRHGLPLTRTLGVRNADLKAIAKTIVSRKDAGQQKLALALYDTGVTDAMYLAGILADGRKMSAKQLEAWAVNAAGLPMIAEYTVPWVAVETAAGRELARTWIGSTEVASSGWTTLSGMVATLPDAELDLTEIERLLGVVERGIDAAQNRERYTMNGFLIAVGTYVQPLLRQAKAAADRIGEVSVDVGATACQVPVASACIAKVEALGRVGKKRKTIRC